MASATEHQQETGFFNASTEDDTEVDPAVNIRPFDDETGEQLLEEFQNQHAPAVGIGPHASSSHANPPQQAIY